MVRVHRTFRQKFAYLAIYRCRDCGGTARHTRFALFAADRVRCPLCGTDRLFALPQRDRIDRMYHNAFSVLRHLIPTRLYHCRFCRIQFYAAARRRKNGAAEAA